MSLLKQSDFHIYEENRLQDITLFEAEDVPASVGLVIDNSGSMKNGQVGKRRSKVSTLSLRVVTTLSKSV